MLYVTVTDYMLTHGPCTTAGQCTCFISPMYGFFSFKNVTYILTLKRIIKFLLKLNIYL